MLIGRVAEDEVLPQPDGNFSQSKLPDRGNNLLKISISTDACRENKEKRVRFSPIHSSDRFQVFLGMIVSRDRK